jgi:hypothetical protein
VHLRLPARVSAGNGPPYPRPSRAVEGVPEGEVAPAVSVVVEPSGAGGEHLLLPGVEPAPGRSRGPWTPEQREAVHRALARYLGVEGAPERERRCRVEAFLPAPDHFAWVFPREQGAAAEEVVRESDRLYSLLRVECEPLGMAVATYWKV